MKSLFLCILAFFQVGIITSFAQSFSSNIKFKQSLRPALTLHLNFESEMAEQTILAKLKETGYKPEKNGNIFNKKDKQEGFYKFSGVELPQLANQQLDLYFRVDPVKTGDSTRSSITLMVSKGYENFVSSQTDSATFAASQAFLNSFVQQTAAFQINEQMESQKKTIAAAEKKWNELRDKQRDATDKIVRLQADINNWQQEEILQRQDVDKQRVILRELETKRATVQK